MSNDLVGVIETFRSRIEDHEKRITLTESAIDKDFANFRKDMQRMCDTLIETEKSVNAKLDILLQDFHVRRGQKTVANWVPVALSTIIQIVAIVSVIKYGIYP